MIKLYHCEDCGKSYKNSRSLNTHKYSYHSKEESGLRNKAYTSTIRSDFDKYSHHPEESSEVQDFFFIFFFIEKLRQLTHVVGTLSHKGIARRALPASGVKGVDGGE